MMSDRWRSYAKSDEVLQLATEADCALYVIEQGKEIEADQEIHIRERLTKALPYFAKIFGWSEDKSTYAFDLLVRYDTHPGLPLTPEALSWLEKQVREPKVESGHACTGEHSPCFCALGPL